MRTQTDFPLNDDIIDITLHAIDNVNTLFSFILSSKVIHAVYARRPISILRSVTINQVGRDIIAQALALVRTQLDDALRHTGTPADENTILEKPIRREEVRQLVGNARSINELEDLFSWRYKNRTNNRSQLTADESLRFHRAAYRYWTYCRVFGLIPGEPQPADSLDTDALGLRYLEQFPDDELRAIEAVVLFARETLLWTSKATTGIAGAVANRWEGERNMNLATGPGEILDCYKWLHMIDWDSYIDPDEEQEEEIRIPFPFLLEKIWEIQERREEERSKQDGEGEDQSTIQEAHWATLFASGGDRCQRAVNAQEDLWGNENYSLLPGRITFGDIWEMMPEDLRTNDLERRNFFALLHPPHRRTTVAWVAPIIRQMSTGNVDYNELGVDDEPDDDGPSRDHMKLERHAAGAHQGASGMITAPDGRGWLCTPCLAKFMAEHIESWWSALKVDVGLAPGQYWLGRHRKSPASSTEDG
ncbi:hypothetical protein PUNSTDRAFT_141795 [Punctularia strigosozonata HHB-11173 SS5]|uniref:uncharacterized protein n=1 Tax=Punctularia strigosozonata (strain HHB-11173) TaxID=741275 RepID=UPI000441827F|nr:uncharacterized protein PUNSTDRAFT_141795 [Punctularia strigosozonata HHB-11173 SS5]EIN11426.1 hypothetical protein PUNSTDRAFT_141795 [Punctularia strigosozonata HHB-11173 SS5]